MFNLNISLNTNVLFRKGKTMRVQQRVSHYQHNQNKTTFKGPANVVVEEGVSAVIGYGLANTTHLNPWGVYLVVYTAVNLAAFALRDGKFANPLNWADLMNGFANKLFKSGETQKEKEMMKTLTKDLEARSETLKDCEEVIKVN